MRAERNDALLIFHAAIRSADAAVFTAAIMTRPCRRHAAIRPLSALRFAEHALSSLPFDIRDADMLLLCKRADIILHLICSEYIYALPSLHAMLAAARRFFHACLHAICRLSCPLPAQFIPPQPLCACLRLPTYFSATSRAHAYFFLMKARYFDAPEDALLRVAFILLFCLSFRFPAFIPLHGRLRLSSQRRVTISSSSSPVLPLFSYAHFISRRLVACTSRFSVTKPPRHASLLCHVDLLPRTACYLPSLFHAAFIRRMLLLPLLAVESFFIFLHTYFLPITSENTRCIVSYRLPFCL